MKITIIGWYGTETVGDRAILAGIFSLINEAISDFEVNLGSLYPFFTERTITEDQPFYKTLLDKELPINLFNSKNNNELDKTIKDCDIVMMGGGPLMHINDLFMIEYAFKKAKKLGKKTILFGCGVGPLFKRRHKKSLLNILKDSDLTILRDTNSKDYLSSIYNSFDEEIFISLDPSIRSVLAFRSRKYYFEKKHQYIAVNLRAFPVEYSHQDKSSKINNALTQFIRELAENFKNHTIWLMPMHYFHIGNDDREFLNKIRFEIDVENITVQNKPLSLFETMNIFQHADFSVGMRLHSVIFQSLLNSKNFILDYTEPHLGKVGGFLRDIDKKYFYKNRCINLQETDVIPIDIILKADRTIQFQPDEKAINNKLKLYPDLLKRLL